MPDISINGKTADITLETERTVGDVLTGIDQWLNNSGFRLNGLEIDGEAVSPDAIPLVFSRELAGLRSLDIKAGSRSELALDALFDAEAMLRAFGDALDRGDDGEARRIAGIWEKSAAASCMAADFAELYRDLDGVFSGAGIRVEAARTLVEEMIREITDPHAEAARLEALVRGASARLQDLPLDIQTGKDSRAAETVHLFSAAAEKLFRLYGIMKIQGDDFGALEIDGLALPAFLEDFSGAITGMLQSWQSRDLVLAGDLAEYELAPRLEHFFEALVRAVPAGAPAGKMETA